MAAAARGRVLVLGEGEARTRDVLEEAGFEVVKAPRAGDPLTLVGSGAVDVVLGDLSAPGGELLLDKVRARDPDVPVVLVGKARKGAKATRAAERGALVCGAAGLRKTVERAVRRLKLERTAAVVPFRNRRGEEVAVPSVTATDAKNEFGRVLDTAMAQGAVAITRHDTAKAVLLSIDEYNALVGAQTNELDTLSGEFDALLAKMQTPGARKGMRAAFAASPAELGRAALTAARKRG